MKHFFADNYLLIIAFVGFVVAVYSYFYGLYEKAGQNLDNASYDYYIEANKCRETQEKGISLFKSVQKKQAETLKKLQKQQNDFIKTQAAQNKKLQKQINKIKKSLEPPEPPEDIL